MLRLFLALLAVLLAALGYVFDRVWLYVAGSLPIVGIVGYYAWQVWTDYRKHRRYASKSTDEAVSEGELEDLGIVDVRPEDRDGDRVESAASHDPTVDRTGQASPADDAPDSSSRSETSSSPVTPSTKVAPGIPDPDAVASKRSEHPDGSAPATDRLSSSDQPVLEPLLRSARSALSAHTVCVLAQDEMALKYRIVACVSKSEKVRPEGTFETQAPLLTARMAHRSTTVQALGEDERRDLGYYQEAPAVLGQMAVAPVPRPDLSTTVFLLADAMKGMELESARVRSLLEQYAETVGLLADEEILSQAGNSRSPNQDESTAVRSVAAPTATEDERSVGETSGEADRPRRALIAEEMADRDEADDPLALALVLLNRAQSIARQGDEAVRHAERLFKNRLEDLAPAARVERFGELTYGVFVPENVDELEAWAVELQETMAQETGALEGGVSVGLAVQNRPDERPERLRANAAEALREAYETGTCTIVT